MVPHLVYWKKIDKSRNKTLDLPVTTIQQNKVQRIMMRYGEKLPHNVCASCNAEKQEDNMTQFYCKTAFIHLYIT